MKQKHVFVAGRRGFRFPLYQNPRRASILKRRRSSEGCETLHWALWFRSWQWPSEPLHFTCSDPSIFGCELWFLLLWTYNWSYIYLAFVNSTLTFASYNYSYKSCTLTFRKKSPLHKKRKTLEHAPCACFLSPEWCFRLNIWDCFLYFRLVYPENDLQTKFPKTIQNWFNWIPVIKGFYQDKSENKPVLFQLCVFVFLENMVLRLAQWYKMRLAPCNSI